MSCASKRSHLNHPAATIATARLVDVHACKQCADQTRCLDIFRNACEGSRPRNQSDPCDPPNSDALQEVLDLTSGSARMAAHVGSGGLTDRQGQEASYHRGNSVRVLKRVFLKGRNLASERAGGANVAAHAESRHSHVSWIRLSVSRLRSVESSRRHPASCLHLSKYQRSCRWEISADHVILG
jgi:hypothetical protein